MRKFGNTKYYHFNIICISACRAFTLNNKIYEQNKNDANHQCKSVA